MAQSSKPPFSVSDNTFHSDDDEILIHSYGIGATPTRPSFSKSDADSQILMAEADTIREQYDKSEIPPTWYQHPKIRSNFRLILGSIGLTVIGFICIIIGVSAEISGSDAVQGWIFIGAGALCFIPGIYHVVYVLCAVYGRPGYDLQGLPTFS